ncbi:MAG TPA: PPC domain-containing protein [Gemmataceae bacterium]|nr:PPC domain-containing protein [Gemmataceae bacterium]
MASPRIHGQPKDKPAEPPPKPLYALQLAADAGKTTKLTLRGLRLDMATAVQVGDPKSTAKVIGKGRKTPISNQMNADLVGDTEIDVEVTLPAEVPGGMVPLTLVGPGGESKPIVILVNDDTSRVKEKEPNDGFKEAMPLTAPVIVEASFKQQQDVDVYRIDGKAGEKYRIEIQARRCGSPADPMLSLYDSAGRLVAVGEATGEGKDPAMVVTLPKDGPYFVSALEGFDQGGPMYVYRLTVRRENSLPPNRAR